MTTSLGQPVIIAIITTSGGESAGPLLTGGYHGLYKAAVAGAGVPAFVFTTAGTLSIQHEVILGAGLRRWAGRMETRR
jgi:hypothetical protein